MSESESTLYQQRSLIFKISPYLNKLQVVTLDFFIAKSTKPFE